MTPYVNATAVREHRVPAVDGGMFSVTLLHGTGPDAGRRCIHRVTADPQGRVRSDIVYFYAPTVKDSDVEADFALLVRRGLMSMSQLPYTESMLNRGPRVARGG